jgi:signal transduction histidine kinase
MESIKFDASEIKVLVIDDEEIVRESCLRILSSQGYTIETAPNGEAGLELLKSFLPDLVLVDLKMPGMSGFDVLEKIYAFDATIVTIVITGFATVSSAVEAMKKGTFDFIPKPFQPDELRLVVRRGLERRKLVLETISLRNEKEMLREHFAAIVSHELKSPLGAVQQNLYTLAEELSGKIDDEDEKKIDRLQKRIKELVTLINTWLRVISVDISKISEQFTELDLRMIVENSIETVDNQAVRKDITINFELGEKPIQIIGDEGTLKEAIINLLTNSIKYTPMGGVVDVELYQDQSHSMVSVSDNGIGIDEEDIRFIFTDFYRGKNLPEGERSSGVGLSITNRIIEAHQGTIEVESKLGEGSKFTIKLPLINGA